MKTETDFTIAALRLEEKYTRVNNSGLLEAFGFVQSNALTMDELELALSEYILSNLNDSSRDLGPAVFALGKTHQDKYLDLFKNVMAERLDFDLNSAYQAGIAIENLGVRILYSASPLENPEQTRQRIREYLDRCWHITKKLSHSLRSLGRIHAGRLRHYAPHACARYWKVMCQREFRILWL